MLKRLVVKNFKSLADFSIDFEPFTVLIGQNGSGKTTVLQALDLLGAFLKGDVNEYLELSGVDFSTELQSKVSLYSDCIFDLTFEIEGEPFTWYVRFKHWVNGKLVLVHERVKSDISRFRFEYMEGGLGLWTSDLKVIEFPLISVELPRSILTTFTTKEAPVEIEKIVKYLEGVFFLKLDSADELRMPRIVKSFPNIGPKGKFLPAYLHGLDTESRTKIDHQFSRFVGQIVKVKTVVGSDSKVGLLFEEKFPAPYNPDINLEMRSSQVSDGTLLILALLTTIEGARENSTLLLDEIENGIDPNHVEILVELLEEAIEKRGIQVILASHSPLIVNFSPEKGIRYFSRESNGNVVAKKLFDRRELKKMLEYMGPGEIWLNLSEKDLEGEE